MFEVEISGQRQPLRFSALTIYSAGAFDVAAMVSYHYSAGALVGVAAVVLQHYSALVVSLWAFM